jgi:hypothetical protein
MGYEGSYDAVADHMRCPRKGLVPPADAAAGFGGGRAKGTRHESQETARLLSWQPRPRGPWVPFQKGKDRKKTARARRGPYVGRVSRRGAFASDHVRPQRTAG